MLWLEPTKGDIIITPGQRLSFLQQDHFKYDTYDVINTVIMGNQRLYEIMKEKDAIYAKEDFTEEDGMKASELEAEFAGMNGWEAESDAASLLNGLGIDTEFHTKQMSELNGSQKVKVLLAQALFGNPDIFTDLVVFLLRKCASQLQNECADLWQHLPRILCAFKQGRRYCFIQIV